MAKKRTIEAGEADRAKDMDAELREMGADQVDTVDAVDETPEVVQVGHDAGPLTRIPIYLKVKLPRKDMKFEPGDCLGYVDLPDGVDLNLLIDCIRAGHAGEAKPA